jgi:ubiquinone/menaquinone biosynthesis C-methylase UbiE
MDLLDVCCGPGWLTIEAGSAVAPGRATGLDLASAMVDVATANARSRGADNVTFRQGDAEALPFENGSFDRVLCSLGLMHVPHPLRATNEIARALRPGGLAVASVWGPADRTFLQLLGAALRAPGEPLSIDYTYTLRLGDVETFESLFYAAGFADVSVEVTGAALTVPDPGAYWDSFSSVGGLFGELLAELSDAARHRARAAFVQAAERFRGGTGFALPASQLIAVARK